MRRAEEILTMSPELQLNDHSSLVLPPSLFTHHCLLPFDNPRASRGVPGIPGGIDKCHVTRYDPVCD